MTCDGSGLFSRLDAITRGSTFFVMHNPDHKRRKEAEAALMKNAPAHAKALAKQGRKMTREQQRKAWWAKHGGEQ